MNRRFRRVDRWVDDLLHDRRLRRQRGADKEDLEALAAAIELRSAAPGSGLPDPRFVENLHRRIARETQGEALPSARMSRRGLLFSGGAIAASAAAGLVVGERVVGGPSFPDRNLSPDSASWVDVAAVGDVPVGTARRFSTPTYEGFVVNHGDNVEALSAACTHLGCILHFNQPAKRLDCPCHRASFSLDGDVIYKSTPQPLPPLPRPHARVRDGRIEVLLP